MQLRESRLRKAGIAGRARMASELRDMDEEVSGLSRALAVRTLQLEMEYIFGCLEDEALDIAQDLKGAGYLLLRSGQTLQLLATNNVQTGQSNIMWANWELSPGIAKCLPV